MIFAIRKYRKLSDEELIECFNEQSKSNVMQVLYERYAHLVIGLCMKYLKNEMDAEDLTSSIFERLPSKIHRSEIRFFKSWLYQVSKNECLMVIRKKKIYHSEFNDASTDLSEHEETNHEELEQTLHLLTNALDDLKKDQRICITLFYLEEKSYHAISQQLSMDIKKVKSHIQNGKRNLKLKMEA
jgi:RNA polymerase sigma-70 factor (ECF subfamily)